jgi:sensor histidine kinase regulating citrate/malate metabolism
VRQTLKRKPPQARHTNFSHHLIKTAVDGFGLGEDLGNAGDDGHTTKDLGKGTGLGLSQVHGFAELSGGEVRVESQEGKGACFTLYVPRTSDPDAVSPGVD